MPWVSLGLAIFSAVSMNRRPERAWMIAVAAGVGWAVLGAFAVLDAVDVARLPKRLALAARAARATAEYGTQSLIQLCLFFSVPFFVKALAVPAHVAFIALVGGAAAVTLWDPLCLAILRRPAGAALLQAIATFSGLDCVLPLLGVSNRLSLLIAAAGAAAGAPLIVGGGARRRLLAALLAVVALTGVGFAGAARLIPPAPLRFVSGAIGSKIAEREVVDPSERFDAAPERIICATAIAAPRGLRDRLRHVWHHEGIRRAQMTLEIRGGRDKGFRAWSWTRTPAPGRWTCTTETDTGQILGRVAVTIGM